MGNGAFGVNAVFLVVKMVNNSENVKEKKIMEEDCSGEFEKNCDPKPIGCPGILFLFLYMNYF